jgi:hypothetical protein
MKRPRIKRPKVTQPRPKVYPPTPPADAPPPNPATPSTGWMNPGDDGAFAAIQNAQQRQRFIAATSGGASPPFPPPSFPPFTAGTETPGLPPANSAHTPPTTPVVVSTGAALEITPRPATAGAAATIQDIERRLSTRPSDIISASRGFADALKTQADELRATKPNDPARLAQYNDLIDFLDKLVTGLGALANALEEAFATATAERDTPEPAPLAVAAEIARQLQLGTLEWLEQYRTAVLDIPIRIVTFCAALTYLHYIGADYLTAVGTLGYLVRSAGAKKPTNKNGIKKKRKTPGKKR